MSGTTMAELLADPGRLYAAIRDEQVLWVNIPTDALHRAYDVARDAEDVDTAVRIAFEVWDRNRRVFDRIASSASSPPDGGRG